MLSNIKQTGPTCGIYALLNGMYAINCIDDVNKAEADELVAELLDNHKLKSNKNGLTFLGEFFDYDLYTRFIQQSFNNFKNRYNLLDIEYNVTILPIKELKEDYVIEELIKNTAFALISISTARVKKKNTISHWILINGYDPKTSTYNAINSIKADDKKYSYIKLKRLNDKLSGTSFYWKNYKQKKLKYKLKKAILGLENNVMEIVLEQYALKEAFLKQRIIEKKIDHTFGQIILVKKLD